MFFRVRLSGGLACIQAARYFLSIIAEGSAMSLTYSLHGPFSIFIKADNSRYIVLIIGRKYNDQVNKTN